MREQEKGFGVGSEDEKRDDEEGVLGATSWSSSQ